ncbi:MAG: hypothetical protein HY909_01690 [Deltaproteobacteria bacterium]|nr:hypothetical protein [Deltaproteobacteria bacterium]
MATTVPRALLIGLLTAVAGCTGADPGVSSASQSTSVGAALTVVSVSAGSRVLPGGALSVTVTARNTGNTTWSNRTVALVLLGEPSWRNSTLTLARSTRPNQTGTFSGTLTAPSQVGRYALAWQPMDGASSFGELVRANVEVTCSDGVFCNGAERFANGRCVAGNPPCDDGVACTTDTCDEANGVCDHTLGADCAPCAARNCNPNCHGNVCGDDGCGGSCGTCAAGLTCIEGACVASVAPGTCANPLQLLGPGEALLGLHTVTGDTSLGINGTVPQCNTSSTAKDLVYTFTVPGPDPVGLDARMTGFDSVLSLRMAGCADTDPATVMQPNWCSDDASPPGNYGSRIATMLNPGTYYLIADGYNAQQTGPFTITANFVAGCIPQCDGKFCGDDGCGGQCGACGAGTVCGPTFRCVTTPCSPDCRGRQCGSDGCGGSCGSCTKGNLCVEADGACRAFQACDHARPVCRTACSSQQFCGTDCQCHRVRDPLPDMIVDRTRLQSEVVITTATFGPASCAIVEACVGGPGTRRLMRFTVASVNQGQADLVAPPADQRPDLFDFSACHGHYHFNDFASYALLDAAGRVVVPGRKQAYCMEDSRQVRFGPNVSCEARYTCEAQGILAGWSDVYGNDLDCQWLDITDVPPGTYQLSVSVNPGRTFEEASFDNNTTTIPITIP